MFSTIAPFRGQWLAHSIYLSICQWMNAWERFLKDRALGTDSVHGLEAYLAMTNQFWKQVELHLCYWDHSKSLLDQCGHSILWTGWEVQWGLEMSEDPNTTVVTPTATQWEWPLGGHSCSWPRVTCKEACACSDGKSETRRQFSIGLRGQTRWHSGTPLSPGSLFSRSRIQMMKKPYPEWAGKWDDKYFSYELKFHNKKWAEELWFFFWTNG